MAGVDHMAQQLAGADEGVAPVEHQGFDIAAGDVLFLVRQILEPGEHVLHLLIVQLIAHGCQLLPQGVLAGVLAQNHGVLGNAHIRGLHDLIGLGVGDDAVLVDAGLMSKGVGTHNGLGWAGWALR